MSATIQVIEGARTVVTLRGASAPLMVIPKKPTAYVVVSGRQGPAGPKGESGQVFEHTQSAPSDVWTVNHNLGFRPGASVLSPGGAQLLAEVLHISANQLQVFFDSPQTGRVICS